MELQSESPIYIFENHIFIHHSTPLDSRVVVHPCVLSQKCYIFHCAGVWATLSFFAMEFFIVLQLEQQWQQEHQRLFCACHNPNGGCLCDIPTSPPMNCCWEI